MRHGTRGGTMRAYRTASCPDPPRLGTARPWKVRVPLAVQSRKVNPSLPFSNTGRRVELRKNLFVIGKKLARFIGRAWASAVPLTRSKSVRLYSLGKNDLGADSGKGTGFSRAVICRKINSALAVEVN